MPPKKGKGGKAESAEAETKKIEEEIAKAKALIEKRKKDWEDCWDRKLKQAQAEEDCKACCDEDFIIKPRTQSDVWIKVLQKGGVQDVTMCFKHVPVPKPKPPPMPRMEPPPLPPLPPEKKDKKKGDKKKGDKSKDKKKVPLSGYC